MLTLWFNPRCSKCRIAKGILDDKGVQYKERLYLVDAPSKDEIVKLFEDLKANGLSNIREMLREKEETYKTNDIKNPDKSDDEIIDIVVKNPILLKRPIAQWPNNKAMIAIPPELLENID